MPDADPRKDSPALGAHLRGIGSHGFDRHGTEIGAANRLKFAEAARKDITGADRLVAFKQQNGTNTLYGNSKSGMAGWLNHASPDRSTYFRPSAGVDRYVAAATKARAKLGEGPKVIAGPSVARKTATRLPAPAKPAAPKAGPPQTKSTTKAVLKAGAPTKTASVNRAKATPAQAAPPKPVATKTAGTPSKNSPSL